MGGILTNGLSLAEFPLTGDERFNVDTGLGQGQNPQSEAVTLDQVAGYARPPSALTDGATIATDASLASLFTVTLGGNRTLAAPTNGQSGQTIRYKIVQDGTGNRTLTYNAAFKFSGSSTLTTTIAAIDMITATYDGTNWLSVLNAKFA